MFLHLCDSSIKKDEEALKSKFEKYSTDDLKKMANEISVKMDKEIEIIRARYAKQRKELEAAILKKKKK